MSSTVPAVPPCPPPAASDRARRRLVALVAAGVALLLADGAARPTDAARCVAEVLETDAASGRLVLRVAPACLAASAASPLAPDGDAARCDARRALVTGLVTLLLD